jgi:hypothetical protein
MCIQYQSSSLEDIGGRWEPMLLNLILDGLKNYPESILLGSIFFL